MERKDRLFQIFSRRIRGVLEELLTGTASVDWEAIEEIRLRVGEPLYVICRGREYVAGAEKEFRVSRQDVEETLQIAVRYSMYAFEEEVRQGFLTVQGGHRIGVAGRVVAEQGRIRTIQPVTFLNIRFSHQVRGCADTVLPFLLDPVTGQLKNTLLISPPRCGKTTLLRDIIRQVSDGEKPGRGYTVGVVDERSEIAACFQGIPQNDVGRRTDVLDNCPKALGMMMLIRSMAPEVVAADEIGGAEDLEALRCVMNCGCRILATVHGTSMEDIRKKPGLREFLQERRFERYVVLGNRKGPGTILEISDGSGAVIFRAGEENRRLLSAGRERSCG